MKKYIILKYALQLFGLFIIISCTEPYALQSTNENSSLVIEATITNELKHQEVKLTRTYRLGETGATFEEGATIKVISDNGSVYNFQEDGDKYISTDIFQAEEGQAYRLTVETANGKNYLSNLQTLTTTNEIESVTATAATVNGENGVQIAINSFDPSNTSKYYQYTYEETYKVIVPRWSPNTITLNWRDSLIVSPRVGETRICYSSNNSNEIIITDTKELIEDRVFNLPIRFIAQSDYSIANRYSILVKQYVHNYNSYNFYKILKTFSTSENLLSQIQPGFIYGNIECVEQPNEKVIGMFSVASVSSKRIFFNYEEVFPGQLFPPYLDICEIFEFTSTAFGPLHLTDGFQALKSAIISGRLIYYNHEGDKYRMVKPICGDCTSFSSNVIPSFWQ